MTERSWGLLSKEEGVDRHKPHVFHLGIRTCLARDSTTGRIGRICSLGWIRAFSLQCNCDANYPELGQFSQVKGTVPHKNALKTLPTV
jgi:hypothetical protein